MELTSAVVEYVTEVSADDIPVRAREQAQMVLADNYGLAFAGASEPSVQVLRKSFGAAGRLGPCALVGETPGSDLITAAVVNGAAMHALDYDAMSYAVWGFTGSAMTAALAAYADASPGLAGRDVVTALCAGWEVAAAIGRAINPSHYASGWHPTATLAQFAATCAIGRARGLNARQLTSALSVATAEASGVKIMIGNMINPYHVGKAARNGLVAVEMAANGFVGHPDPLGAPNGFLNMFKGVEDPVPGNLTTSLGSTYDLVTPGAAFKIWPCCGLIHSGLDAIQALKAQHQFSVDDVERVELKLHEFVPVVMHVQEPDTGYAAKFSIPYTIALALLRDRLCVADFDDVDQEVVDLGRRVSWEVADDLHGGDTVWTKEYVFVSIHLRDGRILQNTVHRINNQGVGPEGPIPALRSKFGECLARSERGQSLDSDTEWNRHLNTDNVADWRYWGTN